MHRLLGLIPLVVLSLTAQADTWPGMGGASRTLIGTFSGDGNITLGTCAQTKYFGGVACTNISQVGIAIRQAHTLNKIHCLADRTGILSGDYSLILFTVDVNDVQTQRGTLAITYAASSQSDLVSSAELEVAIPSTAKAYVLELDAETAGTNDFEFSCWLEVTGY